MSVFWKKYMVIGFIGIASILLLTGCAAKQAEQGQSVSLIDEEIDVPDEMKSGPGLFSGKDGEFVIYRK
jgi:hypothetical protein